MEFGIAGTRPQEQHSEAVPLPGEQSSFKAQWQHTVQGGREAAVCDIALGPCVISGRLTVTCTCQLQVAGMPRGCVVPVSSRV